VRIDFEILSVSYIISESFLLGLNLLMVETEKQNVQLAQQTPEDVPKQDVPAASPIKPAVLTGDFEQGDQEKTELFLAGLKRLTPKEQELYDCYVAGLTTDVIMEKLNIKENTLKFHSKNLYSKLGVKSRKQLMELHKQYAGKPK